MTTQPCRLSLLLVLGIVNAAITLPLAAISQTNPSEAVAIRQLDPAIDLRIAKKVTLDINSISLQRTFEDLSKATGVQLRLEPEISQRRVILKCKDQSLFSMLNAIGIATNCSWFREELENKVPFYTLYRTEKSKQLEKQAILLSENRVSLVHDELIKAEIAAFSNPQQLEQAGIVADLFASFSDEVKKQTLQISNEFYGTHDGSPLDMKYYFIGGKSYDKLSPELQKICLINVIPTAFEIEHNLNAIGEASRLKGSYIGIQASFGTYSLAVARKGEDVASSFAVVIHRKGLPFDTGDDSDPELNEQIARGNLVALGGLTQKQRLMKFTGADFSTKILLSSLLDSLFKKSSIPVASDSFLATEASFFSNLLTDKPQYSLAEVLERIAKAHAHEFRVSGGVLVARTVASGLDLRAELPSELMQRLSVIALDKKKTLTLRDALEVASLSEAQFEHILYNFSVPIPQREMLKVKSIRPLLRLFGSLSRGQIEKAFTKSGFRSADMSVAQRPLFDRLAYIGLPGKPPGDLKGRPQGLYLFRQPLRSGKNRIALCLVSGSDEDDVRVFELPIFETEGVMTYASEL